MFCYLISMFTSVESPVLKTDMKVEYCNKFLLLYKRLVFLVSPPMVKFMHSSKILSLSSGQRLRLLCAPRQTKGRGDYPFLILFSLTNLFKIFILMTITNPVACSYHDSFSEWRIRVEKEDAVAVLVLLTLLPVHNAHARGNCKTTRRTCKRTWLDRWRQMPVSRFILRMDCLVIDGLDYNQNPVEDLQKCTENS